jgi:hypothetical protein
MIFITYIPGYESIVRGRANRNKKYDNKILLCFNKSPETSSV